MTEFSTDASFEHVCAFPGTSKIERSDAMGWKSLLLTHSRVDDFCGENETMATPDQIVHMITSGHGTLEVYDSGCWHGSVIQPGTIHLARPSERFRYRWDARQGGAPVERLHIFFADDILIDAVEHFRRAGQRTQPHSIAAFAVRDDVLEQVGSCLLSAMRDNLPDIYAEASAHWMAVHLLARHACVIDAHDHRRPGKMLDLRMTRGIDYMQAHLGEAIELASIAREAGISKFHFTRVFREALGVTPMKYLFDLRLDHASGLLLKGEAPVSVVAFQSGFTNISHFSRLFRQRFGVAPTTYRKERLFKRDVSLRDLAKPR